MIHKDVEDYILSMPNSFLDYPFGEGVAVYKVRSKLGKDGDGKMFALIAEGSEPLRLSLKCDPQLAEVLREKYETVLPGYHLNKKHWNTIQVDGRLKGSALKEHIQHSYELIRGKKKA